MTKPKPKPVKPTKSLDELAREFFDEHIAFNAVSALWSDQHKKHSDAKVALNIAMQSAGVPAVVISGHSVRIDDNGHPVVQRVHVVPEGKS